MDEPDIDCALCPERPFGGTRPLALGYGVVIWVCAEHGSPELQRLRPRSRRAHEGAPAVRGDQAAPRKPCLDRPARGGRAPLRRRRAATAGDRAPAGARRGLRGEPAESAND